MHTDTPSPEPASEPLQRPLLYPLVKLAALASSFLHSTWALALPALLFALLLVWQKEYRLAVGFAALFTVLSVLSAYLAAYPTTLASWGQFLDILRKMAVILPGAALFYKTSEITDLIKTLTILPESIVLALAVTLRFIPTIQVEMTAIRSCLKIKGLRTGLAGWLTSPVSQMEYLKKTSYQTLKIGWRDVLVLIGTAGFIAALFWTDYHFCYLILISSTGR